MDDDLISKILLLWYIQVGSMNFIKINIRNILGDKGHSFQITFTKILLPYKM
jgi:hypothetical protein